MTESCRAPGSSCRGSRQCFGSQLVFCLTFLPCFLRLKILSVEGMERQSALGLELKEQFSASWGGFW